MGVAKTKKLETEKVLVGTRLVRPPAQAGSVAEVGRFSFRFHAGSGNENPPFASVLFRLELLHTSPAVCERSHLHEHGAGQLHVHLSAGLHGRQL